MQVHLAHLKGHVPLHMTGLTIVFVVFSLLFPTPFLPDTITQWVGLGLVGVGTLLFVWAEIAQRALHHDHYAHQNISSFMRGPYRFSRQPLYVAITMIVVGLGVLLNSFVMVLLLSGVMGFVFIVVVPREEDMMRQIYPHTYPFYQKKVRLIV